MERLWRRQLSGDKKLMKRRLFLQIGHRESVPFLRYFVVLYCNRLLDKKSSRCEGLTYKVRYMHLLAKILLDFEIDPFPCVISLTHDDRLRGDFCGNCDRYEGSLKTAI